MSALAPTLQAFFTDRLVRQRQASPETWPPTVMPCDFWSASRRTAAQAAVTARHRRPGCQPDRQLPRPPGTGAGQQRAHPQRPAGRHPLAIPLCRTSPSRARRAHPARARHSSKAIRPSADHLPQPHGGRRLTRRPDRSTWTGRRDHALLLLAVQTGLRASELIGLTCGDLHLGRGAARELPREGTKGADHSVEAAPCPRPARLARRTRWRSRGPALPHPSRPSAQPRRRRTPARQVRIGCAPMPVAADQADLGPRPPPYGRHAVAQAGVDTSVIALWLGHEHVETTQIYLHADLSLKEHALARTQRQPLSRAASVPPTPSSPSWRACDYADLFRAN